MTTKNSDQSGEAISYPFECPFCDYEFRKERYLGRRIFTLHPEKVVKDGLDPEEEVRYEIK